MHYPAAQDVTGSRCGEQADDGVPVGVGQLGEQDVGVRGQLLHSLGRIRVEREDLDPGQGRDQQRQAPKSGDTGPCPDRDETLDPTGQRAGVEHLARKRDLKGLQRLTQDASATTKVRRMTSSPGQDQPWES